MTRIIAGAARGRRLRVPAGVTRPTTDRVREAMFSSVDSALRAEGLTWAQLTALDLYAGSGALGLEALSRGARGVDFVERDPGALKVLRQNVTVLGLAGARVQSMTVRRLTRAVASAPTDDVLPGWQGAGLVFADPPYEVAADVVAGELAALAGAGWISPQALIVVERPASDADNPLPLAWHITAQRRYGDTCLWYGHVSPAPVDEELHA